MRRGRTRREFLALTGMGAAALLLGCSEDELAPALPQGAEGAAPTSVAAVPSPTRTASPTPTATPEPTPRPAGHELRRWLPDTEWETEVSIRATGREGPVIVVLGGAHGNEPGGYHAATEAMNWEPEIGVLAIAPRLNVKAIDAFAREIEDEGDLNRQYPGDRQAELPTARITAEVTALARELHADLLLDLHESWAFFVDREAAGFVNRQQSGTAYLGQTLTAGVGPLGHDIAGRIAAIVNADIPTEREHFVARDGWAYRAPAVPEGMQGMPGVGGRGRSSLSLGGHVPGLTPLLVETAQHNLPESRRIDMHLAVVRAAMEVMAL